MAGLVQSHLQQIQLGIQGRDVHFHGVPCGPEHPLTGGCPRCIRGGRPELRRGRGRGGGSGTAVPSTRPLYSLCSTYDGAFRSPPIKATAMTHFSDDRLCQA